MTLTHCLRLRTAWMLDFFNETFRKQTHKPEFGLCDNEDGTVAFIDETNKVQWIAVVKNPNVLDITFTAIDKGIINDDEDYGQERCDGMLTTSKHLYFVELKNERRHGWKQKGISQLESTIKLFDIAHPEKKKKFAHKKAYVCNKKHPCFHVINNEQQLSFYRTYNFRLDIQGVIKV